MKKFLILGLLLLVGCVALANSDNDKWDTKDTEHYDKSIFSLGR